MSEADRRSFVGTDAPTLREALSWTREADWQVNVELKSLHGGPGEDDFVERVVRMIVELGMIEQVIISSFDHPYLTRVRRANPRLKIAALRNAGIEVNVYTVNEEADMRWLARAGASGIITDFPQRLGPFLAEMHGR